MTTKNIRCYCLIVWEENQKNLRGAWHPPPPPPVRPSVNLEVLVKRQVQKCVTISKVAK